MHYSGSPQFIDGFNDLTRQEYDWSVKKGCFFLISLKNYFSIASEKQPDADNKNKIAFGRSDWLHEFKLSANWLKTTERYVPEIYFPKKGFHFDTE